MRQGDFTSCGDATMTQVVHELTRYVDHMSLQQWTLLLIAVIALGMLCLRGFGSRANY